MPGPSVSPENKGVGDGPVVKSTGAASSFAAVVPGPKLFNRYAVPVLWLKAMVVCVRALTLSFVYVAA